MTLRSRDLDLTRPSDLAVSGGRRREKDFAAGCIADRNEDTVGDEAASRRPRQLAVPESATAVVASARAAGSQIGSSHEGAVKRVAAPVRRVIRKDCQVA